ncbi:hypothetical protein [Nocardia sp. NPDC052566]|uniref:hypothetical protein n=1 Tax=Nocardia sp. NPDC052566 TaxID=3364330 RepID=UPI0037C8450A
MTFQIPEPGGDDPANRFEFLDRKGKTHSMPKLEFLPAGASEYLEGVNSGTIPDPGLTSFLKAFMAKAEPKIAAVVDGLSRDQLAALRDEWNRVSRVTEGESSASDGS